MAGDTNGIADIFLRDLAGSATTLVSVGAYGGPVTGSDYPVISDDGRYVGFLSSASGLVAGDDTVGNVFVRDLVGLTTVNATATLHPKNSQTPSFFDPAISADGSYVAFGAVDHRVPTDSGVVYQYNVSRADLLMGGSNVLSTQNVNSGYRMLDMTPDGRFIACLATGFGNNHPDYVGVQVWDTLSNSITPISGQPGLTVETTAVSSFPSLSSNGQYVAYVSTSTNLAPLKPNGIGGYHLYRYNMATGSNTLVDVDPGGSVSFNSFMSYPRITPDGRYVVFDATDSNLGGDPREAFYSVYLNDQQTNGCDLISARQPELPSATAPIMELGPGFSVNSSGRYVAYASVGQRISGSVPFTTNAFTQVFVADLWQGTSLLASVDTNNTANADGSSSDPVLNADGGFVAFRSLATNLVTNNLYMPDNVFLRGLSNGTTAWVSTNLPLFPNQPPFFNGGLASFSPLLDASGSHLLYQTGQPGVPQNLYFYDVASGATYSLTAGIWTNLLSALTPDGRFAAFCGVTAASGPEQVCLWDSQAHALVYQTLASATSLAASPDGNRLAYIASNELFVVDRALQSNWVIAAGVPSHRGGPNFSADGRYLVFATASSLAANDTNLLIDIYRYDFTSGSNLLISLNVGEIGTAGADSPVISPNGRFIAYRDLATNLLAAGANGYPQIYCFDSASNTTALLSASALVPGGGNNGSFAPVFSADSSTLLFRTYASDLITNDFGGSGAIYAFTLASSPPTLAAVISLNPSGSPLIQWPATAGKTYGVQYKNNLTDSTWLPLPGNVSVSGATASTTDEAAPGLRRFYRVQSH